MTCGGCLPLWLDCTPAVQEARIRQLNDLMAKANSGVSSIADRGRSVAYRDPAAMQPTILRLQKEITACATGRWPSRHALSYVDLVKGL